MGSGFDLLVLREGPRKRVWARVPAASRTLPSVDAALDSLGREDEVALTGASLCMRCCRQSPRGCVQAPVPFRAAGVTGPCLH